MILGLYYRTVQIPFLLIVFKDTLTSFVAGIQLTATDMLRVGDWIEMPQVGADGEVTEIALHTVRVQNWDKTITAVPTWRLMSESFKNWRGMFNCCICWSTSTSKPVIEGQLPGPTQYLASCSGGSGTRWSNKTQQIYR